MQICATHNDIFDKNKISTALQYMTILLFTQNNVRQYDYQALFCVFAILLQCLTTLLS